MGLIDGRWVYVHAEGKMGWVFGGYLSALPSLGKCESIKAYLHSSFRKDRVTKKNIEPRRDYLLKEMGIRTTTFKNGAYYKFKESFEYFGEEIFIPNITLYEGYVLVKACQSYSFQKLKYRPQKNLIKAHEDATYLEIHQKPTGVLIKLDNPTP